MPESEIIVPGSGPPLPTISPIFGRRRLLSIAVVSRPVNSGRLRVDSFRTHWHSLGPAQRAPLDAGKTWTDPGMKPPAGRGSPRAAGSENHGRRATADESHRCLPGGLGFPGEASRGRQLGLRRGTDLQPARP